MVNSTKSVIVGYHDFKFHTKDIFQYFQHIGIDDNTLHCFGIKTVKSYILYGNKVIVNKDYPEYLIEVNSESKALFRPLSIESKIELVSNETDIICIGLNSIDYNANEIIIAENIIDMLSLKSMGFNVLTVELESLSVLPQQLISVLNKFDVFVFRSIFNKNLDSLRVFTTKYKFNMIDRVIIDMKSNNFNDLTDMVKLYKQSSDVQTLIDLIRVEIESKKVSSQSNFFFTEEFESKLPESIKRVTNLYEKIDDKELILLSVLLMYSSLFHKFYFQFDRRNISLNLFLIVLGKSGIGKGKMNEVLYLMKYVTESVKKKEKKKKLILPANTTRAALLNDVFDNEGIGLVFDTEIDTLSVSNRSEFGNFSSDFRKIFQNENLLISRKDRAECKEIINPRVSLLLSGTFSQIKRLINNTEDGLYSRMMFKFYTDDNLEQKDLFSSNDMFFEEIEKYSIELLEFYTRILSLDDNSYKLGFTKEQQNEINKLSNKLRIKYNETEFGLGFANRAVQKIIRIAFILTITRYFNSIDIPKLITLKDEDLSIAIEIVNSLNVNSELLNRSLSEDRPKVNVIDYLPYEFKNSNLNFVAECLGVSLKTVQRRIEDELKAKNPRIIRVKQGIYKKIES